MPASYFLLKINVPEEDIASATGVTNTARTMGGCISVSICTALLHNSMDTGLSPLLDPAQVSAVKASLATVKGFSGEERKGVMRVFGDAYNRQFRVLVAFALCNVFVAGLLVWAIRRKEGRKLGEAVGLGRSDGDGDGETRTDGESSRGDIQSQLELELVDSDGKQQCEKRSIEA